MVNLVFQNVLRGVCIYMWVDIWQKASFGPTCVKIIYQKVMLLLLKHTLDPTRGNEADQAVARLSKVLLCF